MTWLDDLEQGLGRFNGKVREMQAMGAPRRDLTDADVSDWNNKASNRQPPKTQSQIISSVSASNPVRYARMRRDMKWLEKQAVKHGLSPEDARWLV